MSNVMEQEALVNLLEKRGIIKKEELLEEIRRIRVEKNPKAELLHIQCYQLWRIGMDQDISKMEDVPFEERLIFEQLFSEFGTMYQKFRRVEEFGGGWICAGVGTTQTAAIIYFRRGTRTRTTPLSQSEIQRIREHLASGLPENLVLSIP